MASKLLFLIILTCIYRKFATVRFDNLNWKPLEERRNYLKFIFIYKILNGHTAPSLKEAFQFNNERHNTYNLRNRDTDLAPPMPKKEFGKRCFSYNGALHWNNLPHEAKNAESLSSFKSILKQRMSSNLLVCNRAAKITCIFFCYIFVFLV
jgi:hypothetical protein